ncbi:MAG: HD-GYP domain-containing protein [Desulfobulbaceae bacterium]|nr:HD-GYP domain-containing protein [Desulfobulbaceae bacterium]
MNNQHDFDWVFDHDYCGRILKGHYSKQLKARIAQLINIFQNFNTSANPSIPYISAWQENDNTGVWYEFAGQRLLALFNCNSCEVAEIFRDSIKKRCAYSYMPDSEKICMKIMESDELATVRDELRYEVKQNGTVEAVYQLALQNERSIWLKDQASIETYPDDHICLSLGALIDVTKEMKKEEQRQEEEKLLRKKQNELENKLEKQSKELWKAQLDMIYRLAEASRLRDRHIGLHITKMSHYCDILSRAIGLDTENRELLFHATAMHDVGKIGISETILQKPGKLSSKEFEIMKTHSIIGAKLLSGNNMPLLKMAKKIALTHHERWDGKGYPYGLESQEIPLFGRIAAICDVYDALTSERPYKHAWNSDDAFHEVENGKGNQFDPSLVDLFLSQKSEIVKIQDTFPVNPEIRFS